MPTLNDDQLNELLARYTTELPGSGGSQFDAPVSFPKTNYEQQILWERASQHQQRMYSPSADAYFVKHPDGSIVPE